jgi:hypothetical protein
MSSEFLPDFSAAEHAQHQHLQRHHVDFEQGDLVAKAQVVPHAFGLGDALEALQLALGAVHVGDVGALVAEQVLGVGPALVLLADQVLGRHLDVVEKDLVDLAFAVQQLDRAHVTPGDFMSISRKLMPVCGLPSVLVRTRQKIQSPYWPSVVQVFWPLTM